MHSSQYTFSLTNKTKNIYYITKVQIPDCSPKLYAKRMLCYSIL